MGLKFEAPAPLDDAAIRHIVREAESGMAPGGDAKLLLVHAAQMHLTGLFAGQIKAKAAEVVEMAEMVDATPDATLALPEGMTLDQAAEMIGDGAAFLNDPDAGAWQLAKAVVMKPVLPMNRGKFLSKLGIVAEHVKAVAGATPQAPEEAPRAVEPIMGADTIEQPEVTDPEMRDMLGLPPLPESPEGKAEPGPFAAPPAPVQGAAAPDTMASGASSADTDAPPPPEPSTLRDAFVLFREGTEVDDKDLAARLGISRSTVHNYMSGRTTRVKCSLAQARVLLAEIDARAAKLRTAAEIFARVRD